MPPPCPPRVKLGRMISGKAPTSSAAARACSSVWTVLDLATSRPILTIACLKSSRSSPFAIASGLAPIISTPYFARTPSLWSSIDRLRAVCPPSVGRRAEALLLESLAGLGARIIELACLADHDGAGADDQDGLEVGAFGHWRSAWTPPTVAAAQIRRKGNWAIRGSRRRFRAQIG